MKDFFKSLSLKTKEGSRKLFVLFIAILLVSSFIACIFSTNGFTVKIEKITTDARGATLNGELYYPAKTSDRDSLPAILVAHGGGCTYGVTRGIAEELARRGFVVFNFSAYGSGFSEQPMYDEVSMGVEKYEFFNTPTGMLDALNFVRELKFVDTTRIGLTGHSMGSNRSDLTAVMDNGFLSFNDIMINCLYEVFGQSFTEDEISQNADDLAKDRLNEDQLNYYYHLKEEKLDIFTTRPKSICLIGAHGNTVNPLRTVSVAGHEVTRNCSVNIGFVNGSYDSLSFPPVPYRDSAKEAWYNEDLEIGQWYGLDDLCASSENLGDFKTTSIVTSPALYEAIENRSTRMFTWNPETHSMNYFSSKANADIVRYFQETLNYNRGDLTSSATVPLNPQNQIWFWRAILNCIAMIAMIAMIVSLASLLLKCKFFKPCVLESSSSERVVMLSKKRYLILSGITVVFGFLGIYLSTHNENSLFGVKLPDNHFWPLGFSGWSAAVLLFWLAIGALILLVINSIYGKKKFGQTGLKFLNLRIRFKTIMKTLLLVLVLLAAGYLSLTIIEYLFGQDFRFWQTMFTEMKLENWGILLRYVILYIPSMLLIGMSINYTVRNEIREWKDTAMAVIVNSLGIWLCLLFSLIYIFVQSPDNFSVFASFDTYYYSALYVPITVYITRKMYKLTNSVWAGALLNSVLIGWSVVSATGIWTIYGGTSFAELFFGF